MILVSQIVEEKFIFVQSCKKENKLIKAFSHLWEE